MFVIPFGFFGQAAASFVDGAAFFYDANQGTDFTDLSGNGRNGTLTGTATHTTDGVGTYWNFGTSGTDNHYVSTGFTPSNESFTVNTVIILNGGGNQGPIGAWADSGDEDWARVATNTVTNVILGILYVGGQEEDPAYTHSTTIDNKAWMITLAYDKDTQQTEHWINGYKYATRAAASGLLTTAEFQVHRFPPSARSQTITPYRCGSVSFYPNKVFAQNNIDEQLNYFSQYYTFDTAS